MPQSHLTFQQFNDLDVAIAVARQLQDHGIDCIVEKDAPLLGTAFVGGNFESTIYLKLLPDDFAKAHAALGTPSALATELQQQRLAELARPESTHPFQIMWGYGAVIAFGIFSPKGPLLSFICGCVGLTTGYIMAYLKKTLPDGQRVYVYPSTEQKHGKRILVIGGISLVIWLVVTLSNGGRFPWMGPL